MFKRLLSKDVSNGEGPLERFFQAEAGTYSVPVANVVHTEVLNIGDPQKSGHPAVREAGVRLTTDQHVVDVLIPDSLIVAVRIYPKTGEIPSVEDGMTRYSNTRSIVGDTFADLCAIIHHGLKWEGEPQIRETGVQTKVPEDTYEPVEIVTENVYGPTLKVVVTRGNPVTITVFANKKSAGPLCSTFQNPEWTMVSSDILFKTSEVAEYKNEGTLRKEFSTYWHRKKLSFCQYLGFGEKGGANLCMNSQHLQFTNYDNFLYRAVYGVGPTDTREPLYHSNPFWFECIPDRPLVGVYLDSVAPSFVDLGPAKSTEIAIGTLVSRFSYYIMVQSRHPYDITSLYCKLEGAGRVFPKWVLGYHQGKFGWTSKGEVLDSAKKFRDSGIPIDSFNIDIDVQHELQTFTINERFDGVFQDLLKMGLKSSTNITPYIAQNHPAAIAALQDTTKRVFVGNEMAGNLQGNPPASTEYSPFIGKVAYSPECPRGLYPDLGHPDAYSWWQKAYETLLRAGLSYVWQDMVTPDMDREIDDWSSFPLDLMLTDNTYKTPGESSSSGTPPKSKPLSKIPAICMRNMFALNLLRSTFNGWDKHELLANKRPFIIGRGGCSGMHRFGALWTGDNSSTWDFMKINLVQCLSLGLSGQFMSGADIGGFARADDNQSWIDPELFIRWHLAAAFLPWYRCHYDGSAMTPWPPHGNKPGKLFQEVYAFEARANEVAPNERLLYTNVLPVCKFYIELRYRFIQLLYDGMFGSNRNGIPISKPLFLQDGLRDPSLHFEMLEYCSNEYLVGSDMLVAPILNKGVNGNVKRNVYLPAGSKWYQFANNFAPLDPETRAREWLSKGVRNPPYGSMARPMEGGRQLCNYDASLWAQGDGDSSNCARHIPYLLPIFLRAGTVIPTVELEQFVGQRTRDGKMQPVTLNVMPGAPCSAKGRSKYQLYLDDGESRVSSPCRGVFDERRGYKDQYVHICVQNRVHEEGNVLVSRKVELDCLNGPDVPEPTIADHTKWLCVAFHHDANHNDIWKKYTVFVRIGNEPRFPLPVVPSLTEFLASKTSPAVFLDDTCRVTLVRFGQPNEPVTKGKYVVVTLELNLCPRMVRTVLADKLNDGYWIHTADLHRTGRSDLIAYGLGKGQITVYDNLGGGKWSPGQVIQELIGPVSTDTWDITGNGYPDLITCYEYGKNMKEPDPNGGKIAWLENPGTGGTVPWKQHYIGQSMSMHRLRVGHFTDATRIQVLGLPIVGAVGDFGAPIPLCLFTAPTDVINATSWEATRIDTKGSTFHVIHEVCLMKNPATGLDSFIIASQEGLTKFVYDPAAGVFNMESITKGEVHGKVFNGCGNVTTFRHSGKECIAAIEPFHGYVLTVYVQRPSGGWSQHIVDVYGVPNKKEEGPAHHLITADINKDGEEELLVALRGPAPAEGVFMYKCSMSSPDDVKFIKYRLTQDSAARIAVGDWDGNGSIDIATIGYSVAGYFEACNSRVAVFSNTLTPSLDASPLTRMPFRTCQRWKEVAYQKQVSSADACELSISFAQIEPSAEGARYISEPLILHAQGTETHCMRIMLLPPYAHAFMPGLVDGFESYVKILAGGLSNPFIPILANPREKRSAILRNPLVQAGPEGALFMLFTKLYGAAKEVTDTSTLQWVLPNGNAIVMPWKPFPPFERFFNSRYIHINVGGTPVASIQFWAAGLGVDCGLHDHSDLDATSTFGEVHLALYNGSGDGGMVWKNEGAPDGHLALLAGEEHGPIWLKGERNDKGGLKYPTHKWQAGGVYADGATAAASADKFDVWVAVEYRAALLKRSLLMEAKIKRMFSERP
ncbi:glycoside hydrolase [Pelomyxa schiedti]|nr:glycoside hydrolase [Pelomyxa schiedti]